MSDSSTPSPSVTRGSSAKTKKKQRHRHRRKVAGPADREPDSPDSPVAQALQVLERSPTVANAFRAWLVFLRHTCTPVIYRSAANFARVFQNECVRASGRPNISEAQHLSTRFLEFSISEFAGCFILDKNIEKPSKIARVGSNLCCFAWFLGKHSLLPPSDVQILHDLCSGIGDDMIRSARAERVGEAYAEYVRATYEDSGVLEETENVSLFNGGFEVAYVGARFCLLTDFGESGLNHAAFRKFDPVKVRLPLPLTRQLKTGDHLHLEIRQMKKSAIWLPTECFGVFPDSGEDYQSQSSEGAPDGSRSGDSLAAGIGHLSLSAVPDAKTSFNLLARGIRESASYQATLSERAEKELTPDGFEEGKFTDGYFSAFEIDIGDEDQGFGIFEDEDTDESSSQNTEGSIP